MPQAYEVGIRNVRLLAKTFASEYAAPAVPQIFQRSSTKPLNVFQHVSGRRLTLFVFMFVLLSRLFPQTV